MGRGLPPPATSPLSCSLCSKLGRSLHSLQPSTHVQITPGAYLIDALWTVRTQASASEGDPEYGAVCSCKHQPPHYLYRRDGAIVYTVGVVRLFLA